MTRTNLSILLVAAGYLGGCAATIPELVDARVAYADAATGPAATLVPADLHKAQVALEEAEAAFRDDPRGYHAKDLAYVAQRKAELAEALAAQAGEEKTTAAANSQYQTTQDAIMLNTKSDLAASQSDLAATRTDLAYTQDAAATTAAQLSTSEKARTLAEARASEAMAALAKMSAVREESRGLVITLSGSVLFRSDEATLLPEAQERLAQVADALMATRERFVIVEGHTDSQGTDAYNLDLSKRRADAVRSFLTQKGYDPDRIRAVGIGEARPIAENETAEGRANNRRVEVVIERAVASSAR